MRSALLAAGALLAAAAHADQKPLWEVGAGVGAFMLPDYRGSDQSRGYVLPVPYFVYRGQFLKSDRHGVRGQLFEGDRAELNLSLGASLPVDSSRNDARLGMPSLRPSVEVGPSLDIRLWSSGEGADQNVLKLRLPVRTAFTLESPPRSIGWIASPNLDLDLSGRGAWAGWNFGMLAGPIFGDRRQHQYFYGVAPEFATPERPAYEAPGGYAGMQFIASASKRFASFWVGGYVRFDTLRGASFEASPLLRSDTYFAAGAAISWIFGASSETVEADE
ncbi:MAG: MipA/OmpV family protein [Burkholderiales bacterium]